jgi:hypothetical protein
VKLKFERFEGLTSFSVREEISAIDVKILQIGLETIVKSLDSTLVVNLSQAKWPDGLAPVLVAIKKHLPNQTTFKIHWVSPVRGVGDFPAMPTFTSRLQGFKHRQIGERLILDDQIHELAEKLTALQAKVAEVIGDESKAHELILRHRTLKEQERILKETIHTQKERMKLQVHMPTVNEELAEKLPPLIEEVKKAYGMDIEL